ncbi:MAG: phosphotransferase system enzyme component [Gemmatimonadetes bacterium]|nr:phosphotransferase system enzyme component [Gemmatimonadota bacterium]
MTLVLNRIDDRLIHGQVVVGWGQPLDVKFIVLVDDAVAESDWEQDLYRMAVPPEMEVRFLATAAAPAKLDEYRTENQPGILLTGDIATMRELVRHGGVRDVNIGGIHHRAGRVQHLRYVFLTPGEQASLRGLVTDGAVVTAQDVPAARAVPLEELLASREDG